MDITPPNGSDGKSPADHDDEESKVIVHVEVRLREDSTAAVKIIKKEIDKLIQTMEIIEQGPLDLSSHEALKKHVQHVLVSIQNHGSDDIMHNPLRGKEHANRKLSVSPTTNGHPASDKAPIAFLSSTAPVPYYRALPQIYVYVAYGEDAVDMNENGDLDDSGSSSCTLLSLPNKKFEGLWESLVYDRHLKIGLLNYASTAMHFSNYQVDQHLVSWNRVVLLYGPPGTGKTSLCRALAHKLAIRLNQFESATLIEVNAHSLFSKWFSESGKLVARLFSKIKGLCQDETALVFVLIDEVESLTAARKTAISGVEPSDALRVVNAVLTQLDSLRTQSNCIILTTSNVTRAIDSAFLDRADIKQYIGPPSLFARYEILRTCLDELIRKTIISAETSIPPVQVAYNNRTLGEDTQNSGSLLLEAAEVSVGFSGRALRKLPFLAHAHFLGAHRKSITLGRFLRAVLSAANCEAMSRQGLEDENSET